MDVVSSGRRSLLAASGALTAQWIFPLLAHAQGNSPDAPTAGEVDLVDDPTRGESGIFDVNYFGPPAMRDAKGPFVFPADVESPLAYGIDISHHTAEVPWKDLRSSGVSYVYMKASQSSNGRDARFVEFWKAASVSGVPYGAYHFLTAGVGGREQGAYFAKRLAEVGGLAKGQLQPVVDLEWDTFGPSFKRVVVRQSSLGPVYKDYWDGDRLDNAQKARIVATVNDCVAELRARVVPLDIKPIIYTNRSWWEDHIPAGTVFPECTVWISDYRDESYKHKSPRSVGGHDYYLWQFTDKATVKVGSKMHGPYDANRLLFGGLNHITIY